MAGWLDGWMSDDGGGGDGDGHDHDHDHDHVGFDDCGC